MQRLTSLLIILSFFSLSNSFAQTDSLHLRISVLTCAPGEDLYSTFGHSGIRIFDSNAHTDIVYNWGTFDFSDPNFYIKFTRGTLLYSLSDEYFSDFMHEFYEDKRSVYEQILNLTYSEKNKVYQAIRTNLQERNRYYHYQFLFDNCTTRIRDILLSNTADFHIDTLLIQPGTTYRNMLYTYLDRGGEPWNKLGIDILLGSKIDVPVNTQTAMFLPEYLMHGIDAAKGDNRKLVIKKNMAYEATANTNVSNNYQALFVFIAIAILILILSFLQYGWAFRAVRVVDSLLIYASGLLGILLLFMWFGTDHIECSNNYNLLWALPTNFIAGFFLWKPGTRAKKYFRLVSVINILVLVCWSFLPQELNISLIPIILTLAFRSYKLSTLP